MAWLETGAQVNWVDQALHALLGIAGTLVVLLLLDWGWYWGVLVTMAIAVIREQAQHPGQCHEGCRTDLLFWLLGSLLVVSVAAIVRGV